MCVPTDNARLLSAAWSISAIVRDTLRLSKSNGSSSLLEPFEIFTCCLPC
uniref:Uncharacterized protein n=1 Tax=Rhizophora mucronata TaxID=61149 RepID=A0A2P2R4D2_RHIMU